MNTERRIFWYYWWLIAPMALLTTLTMCMPAAQEITDLRELANTYSPVGEPEHRHMKLFPLGVFEDANMLNGDAEAFQFMVTDIRERGFDTILFTNNFVERDEPLLAVSDRLDLNVFITPAGDLDRKWWPDTIAGDQQHARSIAEQLVTLLDKHPSLRGYVVKDEPTLDETSKVTLMTAAFREADPHRLVTSTLVGMDRIKTIARASNPDVLLINVYPVGYDNALCDFTLTGFGYQHIDFITYIRRAVRAAPTSTPFWIILQAHEFNTGESFSLRQPTVAEVRLQHWLAIGEGAKGLFWFIYSSQQGWLGLADNQPLYEEVSNLVQRTAPLRERLLRLHKTADRFAIAGDANTYVSTLVDPAEETYYAVVANRDCRNAQQVTVDTSEIDGQLRNVETGRVYQIGEPIKLTPGDGVLLEFVAEEKLTITR
ncbi:MAG: hypothetical protein MI924_23535 [Chloroflexales bacterium]|nr:hypothetical protein [Chloroflexales bacterium]